MTERRLIVLRHGKAEAFAGTDHDRRLTDRGRADAAAVGRHLAEVGAVPDVALVSDAQRTRETWAEVAAGCGSTAEPSYDGALYSGSASVMLEVVRSVPVDAATVIVVGHNPSAGDLCHQLDDGDGDEEPTTALLRGFPTSAMALFAVEVPWAELAAETGRVVDFFVPGR